MSRAGRVRQLLGDSRWSVVVAPANGDCFFHCLCEALGNEAASIAGLRGLVADACDAETLELFRVARAAGVPHYEYVDAVDDVAALRARLRATGADRVWADDHAVQTLAAAFGVAVLVVDESARPPRFAAVLPDAFDRCVVLQRTRRQHYNLLVRGADRVHDSGDADLRAAWPALARAAAPPDAAPARKRRRKGGDG